MLAVTWTGLAPIAVYDVILALSFYVCGKGLHGLFMYGGFVFFVVVGFFCLFLGLPPGKILSVMK